MVKIIQFVTFPKMFNKHEKKYSPIEKECLSHILAIQHFEVYLTSSSTPIGLDKHFFSA